MEIWKNIEDYEGYMVSSLGRIKKLSEVIIRKDGIKMTIKEKIKTQTISKKGYYVVNLWKNNKSKSCYVHQLIAQAFIPNPENKPCVDHIDRNPLNNCISNLKWSTQKENMNNPLTRKQMSKTHKWMCENNIEEQNRLKYARSKIKKVA